MPTQQTLFVPTFPIGGNGRKEICSKTWRNVNLLQSVPLRSDSYRHLCDTDSTTVHCQPTVFVLLTAGNVRHTTERCFDVSWLRLHSVLPASSVITAQSEVLATLTLSSRFPLHESQDFCRRQFFVVAHFNYISSIFIDCFRRSKTGRLPLLLVPHKSLFVNP